MANEQQSGLQPGVVTPDFHIDLGHFDLGHIDIPFIDFHYDAPFDDIPFDDIPFDDSGGGGGASEGARARTTAARVAEIMNSVGQGFAQREAVLVAQHQQMVQGLDQVRQRVETSFGYILTAMSQTVMQLQQRINELETQAKGLEDRLASQERQRRKS